MPKLNILLIGNSEAKTTKMLLNSKYLNKLYTNFPHENTIEITFNTFKELVNKCKGLKIDIVFVEEQKMILQGIADFLKTNFVNCIALNSYWTKLILSVDFARNMMQKYNIHIPEKFLYPKEFPLVVKADGFTKIAHSMDEVIKFKQEIFNYSPVIAKSMFLEKFINGEKYNLTSLFDGKNLITIPVKGLPANSIYEYNNKLHTMFRSENADFIGYINSSVIFSNNQIYNIGFNFDFPKLNADIIFIFNSMIYQKLDELDVLLFIK